VPIEGKPQARTGAHRQHRDHGMSARTPKKPTKAASKRTKANGKRASDMAPINGTIPELPQANDIEAAAGPGGRPTKYQPEFARIAEAMCKLGATDAELAAAFDVDTTTIWRWQSSYEEFCNALTIGKAPADNRVARSLFQRAVGYTFDSEKVFNHQGLVVRAKTVEHVPPDPGAAKLWLCNRLPEEWRDTSKVEVTGRNGEPLQIEATAAIAALIEAMPDLLNGKVLDALPAPPMEADDATQPAD
jgi:hypothetical protein